MKTVAGMIHVSEQLADEIGRSNELMAQDERELYDALTSTLDCTENPCVLQHDSVKSVDVD